tara:strand:+ start:808 stop:1353 length:546 start_codon:yes stop_codon:yes gene_type:complete
MQELPIQNPNALFEGPIPGASLTTEVGNRPWENAPKETDLDIVINKYLRRLQSREIVVPILDAIRYGTSITTIVESVIETAVMEGEHTIDIGVLASPVIVEYLKQASEVAKIDYNLSDTEVRKGREKKTIDSRLLEEVLQEMEQEKNSPTTEDIETSAKEIKSSSKGLMARKKNKDDKDGI